MSFLVFLSTVMRNFVIRQVGRCLLPSPLASLDQFHKPFWIYLVGMESRHPCLKLNSPSSYTPNISLLSIFFLAMIWVKLDRMKMDCSAFKLAILHGTTHMVSSIWTISGSRIQSLILPKLTVNSLTREKNGLFFFFFCWYTFDTQCLDPLTSSCSVSPLTALANQSKDLPFLRNKINDFLVLTEISTVKDPLQQACIFVNQKYGKYNIHRVCFSSNDQISEDYLFICLHIYTHIFVWGHVK